MSNRQASYMLILIYVLQRYCMTSEEPNMIGVAIVNDYPNVPGGML